MNLEIMMVPMLCVLRDVNNILVLVESLTHWRTKLVHFADRTGDL